MNLETSATSQPKPERSVGSRTFTRRAIYRLRQFWLSLSGKPGAAQMERAQALLSAQEFALFRRLQPGEQVHSLQILFELEQHGQIHPSLLAAALLHDAGKIRYPLQPWERALIVLAAAVFPWRAHAWGEDNWEPPGWRKPFVVARQHAAWGAELAAQAGSPALTVALIRRHQEASPAGEREEDHLLAWLQAFDDES